MRWALRKPRPPWRNGAPARSWAALASGVGVDQELATDLAFDSWVKEMVTEHVKLCQELEIH